MKIIEAHLIIILSFFSLLCHRWKVAMNVEDDAVASRVIGAIGAIEEENPGDNDVELGFSVGIGYGFQF